MTSKSLHSLPDHITLREPDDARRETLCNLALASGGFHKFREHIGLHDLLDSKAYNIAATYSISDSHGILTLYTMHPTFSEDRNRLEFRMAKVGLLSCDQKTTRFRRRSTSIPERATLGKEQRDTLTALAGAGYNRLVPFPVELVVPVFEEDVANHVAAVNGLQSGDLILDVQYGNGFQE